MAADRKKERAVNVILFVKKLSDKCGSRLLKAVPSSDSDKNLEITTRYMGATYCCPLYISSPGLPPGADRNRDIS